MKLMLLDKHTIDQFIAMNPSTSLRDYDGQVHLHPSGITTDRFLGMMILRVNTPSLGTI